MPMTNGEIVRLYDNISAQVENLMKLADATYNADDRATGMLLDFFAEKREVALTASERDIWSALIRACHRPGCG